MVMLNTKFVDSWEDESKRPLFIYITGCDGTGKSTQATLMLDQLVAQRMRPSHLWLRFPFLFSLPLLAYARWQELSWTEEHGDVRHGYWYFQHSRLLRMLFPWVLLLDATIATLLKVTIPQRQGEPIVCERFVLDMLVDMTLAFGEDMQLTVPGKLFLHLLPRHARIIILDLDEETVKKRRPDLKLDKRLGERLAAFRRLAVDLSLPVLSSRAPIFDLNEHIKEAIGVADGS